jgi:hypothetical protein
MLLLLVMVSKAGMLEIELGVHGMEGMMVCMFYTVHYVTNVSLFRQEHATPAKKAFSKCATSEQ